MTREEPVGRPRCDGMAAGARQQQPAQGEVAQEGARPQAVAARDRAVRPAAEDPVPHPSAVAQQALARLVGQIVPESGGAQPQARHRLVEADPAGSRLPHQRPQGTHQGGGAGPEGQVGRVEPQGAERGVPLPGRSAPRPAVAGRRPAPRRARDRWSRRPSAPPTPCGVDATDRQVVSATWRRPACCRSAPTRCRGARGSGPVSSASRVANSARRRRRQREPCASITVTCTRGSRRSRWEAIPKPLALAPITRTWRPRASGAASGRPVPVGCVSGIARSPRGWADCRGGAVSLRTMPAGQRECSFYRTVGRGIVCCPGRSA